MRSETLESQNWWFTIGIVRVQNVLEHLIFFVKLPHIGLPDRISPLGELSVELELLDYKLYCLVVVNHLLVFEALANLDFFFVMKSAKKHRF